MHASGGTIGDDLLHRCRWDSDERQVDRRPDGADAGKGRQAIDRGRLGMNGVQPPWKSSPLQVGEQCCPHAIPTPRHPHHGDRTRVEKGRNTLGGGSALAFSAGGPHLWCVSRRERDMEDTSIESTLHGETARLKDLQHPIILAQHIGLEGVDPLPPGYRGQMFEEERPHAAPLMRIRDGKRHLGVRGGLPILSEPKIAPHANNVLLVPCLERRDQCDIPAEVQFGKVAQLVVGQTLFRLKKTKIDGPVAQVLEQCQQAWLVVWTDRPDMDGATIAQECIRGIVAWFCHTHHRPRSSCALHRVTACTDAAGRTVITIPVQAFPLLMSHPLSPQESPLYSVRCCLLSRPLLGQDACQAVAATASEAWLLALQDVSVGTRRVPIRKGRPGSVPHVTGCHCFWPDVVRGSAPGRTCP